jgi:crossover junction endodeoxyribonuclease RusA
VITITLSWPDRALSPNFSGKLRDKIRAKRCYRDDAYWLTREAIQSATRRVFSDTNTTIPVSLLFCPPNHIARDLDNMQASVKHGLDGIAAAMGVNDRLFRPSSDWGDVCKGGKVVVTVGT